LLEPDEKEEEKAQQNEEEEEEEVDNIEQVERNREEEEKRKEDALWASFLSDVGQKPKAGAATQAKKVTGAFTQGVWDGPEGLEHAALVLAGTRCQSELGRGWVCPCPICFVSLEFRRGANCKLLVCSQLGRSVTWQCCFWSCWSASRSVPWSPVGFSILSWILLVR